MKICIIGSGYVGLVSGACFAEVGHHVICVDNDQRKVDSLLAGKVPIYEPGLEELVHQNVSAKRLQFTTSTEEGVDNSEVIFIAVPTPPLADGSVDLSYIEKVAREGDAEKLSRAFSEMKDRFASTSYAQQAGLLVAKSLYESGKLDDAKATLTWVAEKSADAGYASVGRLRLAGVLMDAKAYDEALKALDAGVAEEFAALQADRRGDIYLAQGKKPEAKAQYLKAFKAFDERTDYRRLVLVKLNSLGVDPLEDVATKSADGDKGVASK